MNRRWLVWLCSAFVVLTGGVAAFAQWHSAASGSAVAQSDTLDAPQTVSAAAGTNAVTVTVSAGPAAHAPANGYDVRRSGAHVCYISGATGSCPENSLSAGTYNYDVFSVIGAGLGGSTPTVYWTSATSSPASATIAAAATSNVPSTPDMTDASDSNVNNDNITNVAAPTFTGTIAGQAQQQVHIFVDGADKGSASATGSTYSVTTSTLTDGTHTIQAKSTIDNGATFSASNGSLSITIDTQAPTGLSITPTCGLPGQACSFAGNSGHVANDQSPTIEVCATNSFPCAVPQGGPFTITWSSSTGSWSSSASGNLGNKATHFARVTQTDVAGNSGSATSSQFSS